jgi:hypothetical protein
MIDTALIISAISTSVACLSLWFSIGASRQSDRQKVEFEILNLRITTRELVSHIEYVHSKYMEKIERYPQEVQENIELSPEGILVTLKEIEEYLKSTKEIKKMRDLSDLKVAVESSKTKWNFVKKQYINA